MLEAGLELEVRLACLQEPYIDMELRHGGYQIYWPEAGSPRDRQVVIAIWWDLVNKVIVVTKVLCTTLQVIGIGHVVEENGVLRYRSFDEGHLHVLLRLNTGHCKT